LETLICFSHLRWNFVWQRPQHILARMARKYNVLFVEEPVASTEAKAPTLETFQGHSSGNNHAPTIIRLIQPVEQERWIGHGDPLTQSMYGHLLRNYLQSQKIEAPLIWLYTPMALPFLRIIDYRLLIYDVMDQLAAFKGAPIDIASKEEILLKEANLVFTGGVSLYRAKRAFNANTYLFPSGVETSHYAPAAKRSAFEKPADLAAISGTILGYFGVIDERIDLPLLASIAEAHPEWSIVMIGPIVKIDPADLPQAPNLHYLGQKEYSELPAYLAHFDVCLVPFAINEATRYVSPTKTLEYMAAYKPVVSTPIFDVVELYGEVVRVAHKHDDFIRHIETVLTDGAQTGQRATIRRLLSENTWDSIASRMAKLIDSRMASRQWKLQPGISTSLIGSESLAD
jgi:UDP-galactopyranose mutase